MGTFESFHPCNCKFVFARQCSLVQVCRSALENLILVEQRDADPLGSGERPVQPGGIPRRSGQRQCQRSRHRGAAASRGAPRTVLDAAVFCQEPGHRRHSHGGWSARQSSRCGSCVTCTLPCSVTALQCVCTFGYYEPCGLFLFAHRMQASCIALRALNKTCV